MSLLKNDKMLALAKISFLNIFLSLQWKSVTLKCTDGADFRSRIFFKLDCHQMFKSLICYLHEVSTQYEKINQFPRGHFWPLMHVVLSIKLDIRLKWYVTCSQIKNRIKIISCDLGRHWHWPECLSHGMNEIISVSWNERDNLFVAHQIRKSVICTWDRHSYLTHVILPRRSAEFMRKSHPLLEASQFQPIVVSFKIVSFSLNYPETSECQSGRLNSSNQRNSNTNSRTKQKMA